MGVVEYLRLNHDNEKLDFVKSVRTKTINSNGDNDLIIQRNGTNMLRVFTFTPTNGPTTIVDAQSNCGISSSWLFAKASVHTDTEFKGAISGGLSSGKV